MPLRERSSQGVYDELVHESRQFLKAGRLDEAENKARTPRGWASSPGLDADRAEKVLHEIEMIRQQNRPAAAPPAPATPALNVAVGNDTAVAPATVNQGGAAAGTATPATDAVRSADRRD